jgi:methyl-accepting chemotaxis protein-1 (serine sensor receptor)
MKISSLQFKVLLLVAGAMAVSLAVSIFSLSRVYGSIRELDRISREDFQTQEAILNAQSIFKQQVLEWKNVMLRGRNTAALQKHWGAFEKYESDTVKRVREARNSTPHEAVRARLEGFLKSHEQLAERYRKGMAALSESGFDSGAGDKATEDIDLIPAQTLTEAAVAAEEFGTQAVLQAVSRAETGYRIAVVGTVAVMLGALALLWLFVRKTVLSPLRDASRFAERIEQGDLTAEIRSRSNDEIGQLIRTLAKMKDSLGTVVRQVRASAEAVVTASSQVSAGTTDLSQRTEEQASSLEETAASMEELSGTVKQNADNARQADQLARTASKRAEQGGVEVVNVVVTMGDISQSARRIADIISVIDSIAFQTNILALNAAVEAARAGEQGRGFAVVASEVRSLAQRTAQAAKEIKDLIGHSVEKVDAGTLLVEKAGDTIQALVIDVKRVSDLMGSIAKASLEQSRGVQQVNKTVTEMDKVVQQNASAVQQSASAAEGMRQQAEALVRAVSTFRLTLEERVAPALGTLDSIPRVVHRPAPKTLAKKPPPASAQPALASGGDDWEEF